MSFCAASTRQRCATRSGRRPSSSAGKLDGRATAPSALLGRTRDRKPAVGSLPEQRGDLVAREAAYRLLQLDDLLAGRGQGSFGLPQAESRIDAGVVAIARQRVDLLAILEIRLRDVELQVGALQLHVGLARCWSTAPAAPRTPRLRRHARFQLRFHKPRGSCPRSRSPNRASPAIRLTV